MTSEYGTERQQNWPFLDPPLLLLKEYIYGVSHFVTEATQYCVHGGLQQIKGSLAKYLVSQWSGYIL